MTNEELDRFLAEHPKVMGWHLERRYDLADECYMNYWCDEEGKMVFRQEDWRPLKDMNQIMMCLDKWRSQDLNHYYYIVGLNEDSGFEVILFYANTGRLVKHKLMDEICTEYNMDLKTAIALAIKKAVEATETPRSQGFG